MEGEKLCVDGNAFYHCAHTSFSIMNFLNCLCTSKLEDLTREVLQRLRDTGSACKRTDAISTLFRAHDVFLFACIPRTCHAKIFEIVTCKTIFTVNKKGKEGGKESSDEKQ